MVQDNSQNQVASTGMQVVSDINIQSVAPATGRQGQSQWLITAGVPWSQYPERFWIDATPGAPPISPGQHHCAFTIGRGKVVNGVAQPGNVAFHYRFTINIVDYAGGAYPDIMSLTFGPPANTPQPGGAPSGAPSGAPGPSREQSIIRQSSMKAVIDAKVAAYNHATRLVAEGHIIDDGMPHVELITLNAEALLGHILMDNTSFWVDYMVSIINTQRQWNIETNKVVSDEGEGDEDNGQ